MPLVACIGPGSVAPSVQEDEEIREATASEPLTLEVASEYPHLPITLGVVEHYPPLRTDVKTCAAGWQEEYAMQHSWANDDDSALQVVCRSLVCSQSN